MRKAAGAALAGGLVLVAAVGGTLLVQDRLDTATLRRAVIASAERQTGRTVQLGQLRIRLLPTPRIAADDLAIADQVGAAGPWMLQVRHLRAGIAIWPLFAHVVRLDGLAVDGMVLHLARAADGTCTLD